MHVGTFSLFGLGDSHAIIPERYSSRMVTRHRGPGGIIRSNIVEVSHAQ